MRFELLVNGEKIAVGGIDGYGVNHAIVTWVKRDPECFDSQKLPHSTLEEFSREELYVDFGGLDSNDPDRPKHLSWVPQKNLSVGDEVTIRILPAE